MGPDTCNGSILRTWQQFSFKLFADSFFCRGAKTLRLIGQIGNSLRVCGFEISDSSSMIMSLSTGGEIRYVLSMK